MTPHTPQPDTASVAARVAQLSHLPMDNLWALWDEHFDERPNHHHRTWLESRLAYKIQERAFGGLKASVRRKLEEIGETGILPPRLRRDADRLLPGTVLTRVYDDVEHKVTVRGMRDFEYRDQRFTSLPTQVVTLDSVYNYRSNSFDRNVKLRLPVNPLSQ